MFVVGCLELQCAFFFAPRKKKQQPTTTTTNEATKKNNEQCKFIHTNLLTEWKPIHARSECG